MCKFYLFLFVLFIFLSTTREAEIFANPEKQGLVVPNFSQDNLPWHDNDIAWCVKTMTNKPDDEKCPHCVNSAICNTTSTECICTPRYRNDLERGIKNCSLLSCNEGTGPNEWGVCNCTEGWTGIGCTQCTSHKACLDRYLKLHPDRKNATAYCDTSYIPKVMKHYDCSVLDDEMIEILGNFTTFTCRDLNMETANGTCGMESWSLTSKNFPPGYYAENIWCTFYQCILKIENNKGVAMVEAKCLSTKCQCAGVSDACEDENIKFIIEQMTGWAKMTCNNDTKLCEVAHQNLPLAVNLKCISSECVDEYTPAPDLPPRNWTYLYISVGIGSFIFVILILFMCVVVAVDIYYTNEVTKEYDRMNKNDAKRGASFEFRNIGYVLKIKEKGKYVQKTLLQGVSHKIKAGGILALMGPSGAGKTTLLDILARRTKVGKVTGEVLLDGKHLDLGSFKRMTGYVFQDDMLMSTLTVRECLMFSANLRLPDCVSQKEKEERVENVMRDLGISHIADRKIGNELSRGISGGEKRRVSIGMELVTAPHVLFLDEPTSGLDAYNAYAVIKCLVNLAKKGHTIVFSIHQPRSNIFQQFDEIILLNHGRVSYAGSAKGAIEYFESKGYKFPKNFNPADYLIDILTMESKSIKDTDHSYEQSETSMKGYGTSGEITESVQPYDEENQNYSEDKPLLSREGDLEPMIPYATSFLSQFFTLSKRSFYNFVRNFYLMPVHFGAAITMGLLLGAVYWGLGNDLDACQNRVGVIFFMCSLLCFSSMSSLELFVSERGIYTRERANGYYRPMAYFFSKTIFDIIPLRVIPPIIMGSIMYWMIGLNPQLYRFFWFILLMVLFNVVSGAINLIIAAIAPSVAAANVISIIIILASTLFGGFLLNKDSIPNWLLWAPYLSFWNYAFEALLINEFDGVKIVINPKALPGIVYPGTGKFILDQFGMNIDRFAMDVIILIALGICLIGLTGILIKYFVKEKR